MSVVQILKEGDIVFKDARNKHWTGWAFRAVVADQSVLLHYVVIAVGYSVTKQAQI